MSRRGVAYWAAVVVVLAVLNLSLDGAVGWLVGFLVGLVAYGLWAMVLSPPEVRD